MLHSGGGPVTGVMQCFGFVPAVTVGNAIAAFCAATRRVGSNGASPTAAISRARKADKTIATGSGSTGDASESRRA